jgi:hypothetical protein
LAKDKKIFVTVKLVPDIRPASARWQARLVGRFGQGNGSVVQTMSLTASHLIVDWKCLPLKKQRCFGTY